jgi:hypothetical protein
MKWGIDKNSFESFMATGDIQFLEAKPVDKIRSESEAKFQEGMLCRPEEVKDFLRTRHAYVATPAYGCMLSLNYVRSVIALTMMSRDYGLALTTAFQGNESLITRARNAMAYDFLQVKEATDFIFIDSDIGFNPLDIITLVLRKEDIVGVPCVRKNLRLDRIIDLAKNNGHQTYSIDDLEKITGEFVFNFPTGQFPEKIDLAQMTEVLEVGTGLMRVRREVLEGIMEKFPDRYYYPMHGETDGGVGMNRKKMYEFFRAAPDPDTCEQNGGLPDYIPEDYHLCRLARKAGFKVWLAPWVCTTHQGYHLYQGDLVAVSRVGGNLR